jgi:hypothetical protein
VIVSGQTPASDTPDAAVVSVGAIVSVDASSVAASLPPHAARATKHSELKSAEIFRFIVFSLLSSFSS